MTVFKLRATLKEGKASAARYSERRREWEDDTKSGDGGDIETERKCTEENKRGTNQLWGGLSVLWAKEVKVREEARQLCIVLQRCNQRANLAVPY